MAKTTGVYPCYENQFQVKTTTGSAGTYANIADMTSFSVAFDNGVQEWNSFDQEGWTSRLATTKGITITVSGKRNVGDAGNDFVAGLAFKNGRDLYADFKWTFPDGTSVEFTNAVINVTSDGSGETGDVAPLEFEVMSNGKPKVTPAA
jgi:hypothetical protein